MINELQYDPLLRSVGNFVNEINIYYVIIFAMSIRSYITEAIQHFDVWTTSTDNNDTKMVNSFNKYDLKFKK